MRSRRSLVSAASVGLVAASAAAAGVAVGLARAPGARARRSLVRGVDPSLRSPVLWAPVAVESETTLRIGRRVVAIPTPIAPGVRVVPGVVGGSAERPGVRVLLYDPPGHSRGRLRGALLWIHGGGLVMGRAEQAHATCSRLAAELDALVVSVDYRLAPEHPFPAGLDDCETALRWLAEQTDSLGVDPARIAVGGESAGGGLAAALAQRTLDRGGPAICFQALVYPMLDDRTVLRADHDALIWSAASNRFGWSAYLGHPAGEHEDRPGAVPARRVELTGLPPAWIGVGDVDLFHDEDVAYAERLRGAGVECQVHVVPGMYHGADALRPGAAPSRAFRQSLVDALATALAP